MKLKTLVLSALASLAISPASNELQAQVGPSCNFGIWYPYVSNDGVPPILSFAGRGITANFINGDIDVDVLNSYDVIFFGRDGMRNEQIDDIDLVLQWIDGGGGLIGESNALVYDSNSSQGEDWSTTLGVVAGVSGDSNGFDNAISDPTITVSVAHPVTAGLPASFTLTGDQAQEISSAIDLGNNASAIEVATSDANPIIAANYGLGRSVYLPTAVGYQGMDWNANPDYETLFLNAVEWLCEPGGPQVEVPVIPPVPTLDSRMLALLILLVSTIGLVAIRRIN
ncbi:MAG: hypothetical protein HKN15_07600 [Xanthomonadales bacterium]|nr:hypothetical protein [Xanthomonadales bacterium]